MSDDDGIEEIERIAAAVVARDRHAVARALNLVEDRREITRAARRALARALGSAKRARVVGVTGPPGAGKSTLCAAIVRTLVDRGSHVGVVAVDPSSVRSGGALLGDRVRIVAGDSPRLFVRSLAAGGDLGGLSRVAPACIDVLAAANDVVLVETVGVGQSEIDVAMVSDVTLVVVQPASGDALQFLKAGVLEIPDVLVVNKSDLGDAAKRAESELRHALGVARGAGVGGDPPTVTLASATTGAGIEALVDAIDTRVASLERRGVIARRRRDGSIARVLGQVERRVGEVGVEVLGGRDGLVDRARNEIDATPAEELAEALADEAVASIRHGRRSDRG